MLTLHFDIKLQILLMDKYIDHAQTEPLKEFYAQRGILKSVDNQPSIEETTKVIVAALGI